MTRCWSSSKSTTKTIKREDGVTIGKDGAKSGGFTGRGDAHIKASLGKRGDDVESKGFAAIGGQTSLEHSQVERGDITLENGGRKRANDEH